MAPPVVPRAVTRWPVVKSPAGTVFNPLFLFFIFFSFQKLGQVRPCCQTRPRPRQKKRSRDQKQKHSVPYRPKENQVKAKHYPQKKTKEVVLARKEQEKQKPRQSTGRDGARGRVIKGGREEKGGSGHVDDKPAGGGRRVCTSYY